MKTKLFIFSLSLVFFIACSKTSEIEREINFNNNWKFVRADVQNAKLPEFDDSNWRTIDVPHDYSIEDLPEKEGVKQIGPFSEESAGGKSTGHVVGGTGWYRKHFTLDKNDDGKIVKVLFDGVYMNADFWINGHHLGNHPYGYTAFALDLTDYLNPNGEENVLAVEVKNAGKNSRWYSGSGIYRNVKLLKTQPVHFALWGNYITTPNVSKENALVNIASKILNESPEKVEITVKVEVLDSAGTVVQTSESVSKEIAAVEVEVTQQIEIANPQLWSVDSPHL
ncbi:MAG TPA: beta galactosidase jelly roll domain-containing protein, partial [Prolixibacteraceae bacterium]|nr:beta galactosidase jelly roll domain-containing protein [Prolixibacteraceae bacterium]